ncbi:hypothetical protein K501DRAFT_338251 [Backusella circina FSU 941]|nr:hypothetical protein K501DRAFT_338251 [Backusella circina FSU 941]
MLLRAGFTLLWNPFPRQPIIQADEITQNISNDVIGEDEEYEDDCEEINTKGSDPAESANASQDNDMKKKVTISSLTTHNTATSSSSSFMSEATPSSQDLSLDYLQGYLFKSPITSTLLDKPIPGYYEEHRNSDLSDEPPLIYYKRREDYYPPKSQCVHVALERTSSRVHPGTPSSITIGGMPVLTPPSDRRPKRALFKRLKTLVKKK